MAGKMIGVAGKFATLEDRIKRLTEDLEDLADLCDRQGQQIGALTTRVAVLEEARKTTAAEVEAELAKALARLEIAYNTAESERRVKAAIDEAERRLSAKLPPPAAHPES